MDEILNLIESVSEGFPSYFFILIVELDKNVRHRPYTDSECRKMYLTGYILIAQVGNCP